MKGPDYRTVAGVEDPVISLPFRSDRLTMNYFPLSADGDCLQKFLDDELNFKGTAYPLPREFGVFRAAAPLVFFVASRHEHLASTRGNYGAVAQSEFSFGFFAEWHQRKHGQLTFKDWVFVNAFVFVDSELSTLTGRSHWGWPKLQVRAEGGEYLKPGRSRGSVKAFLLDTEPEARPDSPLFAIKRTRERSLSELWGTMPPWLDLPQRLTGYYRDSMALYSGWARMALEATRFTNPGPWSRLVERSSDIFSSGNPLSALDSRIVTVQQFADAADPHQPCFRALVDSTIATKSYRRGGLLGEDCVMYGDSSGGYRVSIARSQLAPIVERLGLCSDRERRDERGQTVSTLRPWAPFWIQQDVEYGCGKVVAWQGKDMPWRAGRSEHPLGVKPAAPVKQAVQSAAPRAVGLGVRSSAGITSQATALVLRFDVADSKALQTTLDIYGRELGGDHVYVVVASSRAQAADAKPLSHLAVCVPVLGQSGAPSYVVPFEYTNHARDAVAAREIQGRACRYAEFESDSAHWLQAPSPEPRPLIAMRVELLSKVGEGAFAKRQPLLELWSRGGLNLRAEWHETAGSYPFEILGLKQFRDTEAPQRACYQSLVGNQLQVSGTGYGKPSGKLDLHVVRHPSYDLVGALGLAIASSSVRAGLSHAVLEPSDVSTFEGQWCWAQGANISESFHTQDA